MDPNHFDTLTRSLTHACSRRGALTTLLGGTLGLLSLAAPDETVADRRHHARKAPCRKLTARCSLKKKSKLRCCEKINQLHCDRVGASGFHCCYDAQQVCSGAPGECCRDLTCGTVPALSGSRCCAKAGSRCTHQRDCCDGNFCFRDIGGSGGGVCLNLSSCVDTGQVCPDGCDPAGSCAGCCEGYCDGNVKCSPDV
jgi:hypothetical protein